MEKLRKQRAQGGLQKMPDRYGEEPDHHTTHAEAAKRGMALIRAAMGWPLTSTESDETTTDGTRTPNTPKREPENQ